MARTTIPKPADRDAWLEVRRPYVGASEAAALVGRHPYLTLETLAVEKLTGETRAESKAMRRGRYFEAAVASMYADDLGVALVEPELLYVFDDVLVATLDRLLVGTDDVVEIKTTHHHLDQLPDYWVDQAQVQLLCSGLGRVRFAVFDTSADTLDEHVVEPDHDRQGELAEAAGKFLASIRRGEVPEGLALGYSHLAALHPVPTTSEVEVDAAVLHACGCLQSIRSERKGLEQEEERLKAVIATALGEAAYGIHGGERIVAWNSVTRRGLDTDRLRREHPDLARTYATTSTYRTMRVL